MTAVAAPSPDHRDTHRACALGQHLLQVTRSMQSVRSHVAATTDDGVSWATYVLLFHLTQGGPQRAKTLAERACVDPSTISRQVDQLVRLGLVERRADPEDGRATVLAATDAGHAAHRRTHERRDELLTTVVRDWDPADVARLTELLGRFSDDLTDALPGIMRSLEQRTLLS